VDESRLRSLRADVESKVELPPFAEVAARGARIRRRRTVTTGAVAALAVVLTTLGVARSFDSQRSAQPVNEPAPTIDTEDARRVLSDPDAYIDPDRSRVDGSGAMLAVVVVNGSRALGGGNAACPDADRRSALRWTGSDGETHAWLDRVRDVRALPDGFVVAAAPRDCRTGDASDARAYAVDESGTPRRINWQDGAERVCASRPADARCSFDMFTLSASFDAAATLPDGTVALNREAGGLHWAISEDARGVYWSLYGRTWQHRDTTAPDGATATATAAGRWGVLAHNASVEFTSDRGITWQRRDLTAALRTVRVSDVDWTVTRSGVLLGVTQLVGRGDVLFRSTDARWSRFVETDVHTSFGLARPVVVGDAVYVVDDERWAVSTDDGATWSRTPPLP
jgi:hypothetical protein